MNQLPQILHPDDMPERFYDTYCAVGRMQLSTRPHARQWFALGIPAETAGRWAAHGYTAAQAWPLMEQELTPETVAAAGGNR